MQKTLILATALTFTALTGCTSTPTMGERILAQSAGSQELGKQWQDGQTLVNKGQKQLKKGKNLVDEGNDNIKQGQRMMEDSEKLFTSAFQTRPFQSHNLTVISHGVTAAPRYLILPSRQQ